MDSAYEWKQYYLDERTRFGQAEMLAMVDRASPLDLESGGALVIPHTRFEVTGSQVATAVSTVLASGVDRVLALGVLHGARRSDRDVVSAARAGDTDAGVALRGVHDEAGLASEEFSLDAFSELLTAASAQRGGQIEIVRRYPFLVGANPKSLPGLQELRELVDSGACLVATTDPMHHGHAYGTPAMQCRDISQSETVSFVRNGIDEQLLALSEHRFGDFAGLAERDRSDFRDTGPVLAQLVGSGFGWQVHDLALVDYAAVLSGEEPSWVAGALITTSRSDSQ